MDKITTGKILKELRMNNSYSVDDLAQYFNNNTDLITSWGMMFQSLQSLNVKF